MTPEQITALTDADVEAARQRVKAIRAARSRDGVSTLDFVLSQVDGKCRTLDDAKAYLLTVAAP